MIKNKEALYIGLMSGTSMDGIDAALVSISGEQCTLLESHQHPLPLELVSSLNRLCQSSRDEIDLMMPVTVQVAEVFSQAVSALLSKAKLSAKQITAIGSHGQTIRHLPPCLDGKLGTSLQIGHPAYIAAQTHIDVIADFRTMDMAVGGHGAPLVPAFHQSLFQHSQTNRAIINIGGIANITWLPKSASGAVIGFDTGPGNTLLDHWYQKHNNGHYDKNGRWGASGKVAPALLSQMLSEPYFQLAYPKSTGRELFNGQWLQQCLQRGEYRPQDVQASLCQLTALTISEQLNKLAKGEAFEVYLCGGGIHNQQLKHMLQQTLPDSCIQSTEALGLAPDWVEAVAFAWLAKRHIHREAGNLPAVTGASKKVVLGGFYPA